MLNRFIAQILASMLSLTPLQLSLADEHSADEFCHRFELLQLSLPLDRSNTRSRKDERGGRASCAARKRRNLIKIRYFVV
jgi:hypothetical protein